MRTQAEEHPRFGQHLIALLDRDDAANLQRHRSIVLSVDSSDELALSAVGDSFDRPVPTPPHLRHGTRRRSDNVRALRRIASFASRDRRAPSPSSAMRNLS
jgi:hypothetical protein